MNWIVPLVMALASLSGCSLDVPKPAPGSTLTVVARDRDAPRAPGRVRLLSSPSSSTDFNCFLVNVAGAGISSHADKASCVLSGNFTRAGSGVISTPTARGGSVELQVTSGFARSIEVYGLFPATTECGGSPGQTSSVYFLGSVKQDLFDTASVEVPISYSGTAAEMTCVPPPTPVPVCKASGSLTQTDQFSLFAGEDAVPTGVAFRSDGTVYVSGYANDSDVLTHALVRASSDHGATWTTLDDFNLATDSDAVATGIVVDDDDTVFTSGSAVDSTLQWLVRVSYDGVTFEDSDQFQLADGAPAQANGIAADSELNVFAVGSALDASNHFHTVVRRSQDNGSSWSTVRDLQVDAGQDTFGAAITVDADDAIWAVGYGNDANGLTHWLVDRSEDGGDTWQVVDSFVSESHGSFANAITISDEGDVYVVGQDAGGSGGRWLTRASFDGGATWSVLDTYEGSGSAIAAGVTIGSDGTIYVAGAADDTAGNHVGLVRSSTDDGANWRVVQTFLPGPHNPTNQFTAINADPSGNIWTTGLFSDGSERAWYVHESVCR